MNDKLTDSNDGQVSGLTGYSLKMIGIVFMLADHIHQMFYMFGVPLWLTMAGRIVAPVFLFLSVESFVHTSNRRRYMSRLLAGFWIMGFVSFVIQMAMPLEDIALMNNIFGTLFVTVFYMWMAEVIHNGVTEKKTKQVVAGILGLLAPVVTSVLILLTINVNVNLFRIMYILVPSILTVEGSVTWVLLGFGFYLARRRRLAQIAVLAAAAAISYVTAGGFQWMMVFAAIPIWFYNGKTGKRSKWFFYIFYPVHIYVFYLISYLLH